MTEKLINDNEKRAKRNPMPAWDESKSRLLDGSPNWQYRAVYWYSASQHYIAVLHDTLSAMQREADSLNREIRKQRGELLASAAMEPPGTVRPDPP